jgi:hypothetical protein
LGVTGGTAEDVDGGAELAEVDGDTVVDGTVGTVDAGGGGAIPMPGVGVAQPASNAASTTMPAGRRMPET